ncbi:rhomboid family intramembrane serine protease, partial [Rhizobiaceae sp. 2RAB30]
ISWAAHVGGIIAGAVLVPIMRRRGVPLFDRQIVPPRSAEIEEPSAPTPVDARPAPRWGRQ